ncbi:MAG: hypothetical protein R3230_01280 [Nitrosopumilaceae archaeon]|nr:hypothetical protein [Nitrosopumilaceae archaeon]
MKEEKRVGPKKCPDGRIFLKGKRINKSKPVLENGRHVNKQPLKGDGMRLSDVFKRLEFSFAEDAYSLPIINSIITDTSFYLPLHTREFLHEVYFKKKAMIKSLKNMASLRIM